MTQHFQPYDHARLDSDVPRFGPNKGRNAIRAEDRVTQSAAVDVHAWEPAGLGPRSGTRHKAPTWVVAVRVH